MTQVFPAIIRFFVMVFGNTMESHQTFLDHLTISPRLCEVNLEKDSDVIIAFVPIVSRAGTGISAAMEKIPEGKPVVLVVLKHTFDQDYIAPDCKLCINRDEVFAVDCLFHEDQGLLRCSRNDEAIRAVKKHLIREDRSEQAAEENKRLLRNRSNDDASKAMKKQQRSEDHTELDHNYYRWMDACIYYCRWIFLVVGITVGIAMGTFVGIGVSTGGDIVKGTVVGIIVSAGVVFIVIITWVPFNRDICHTMI